jgi:hypothetical protein
MKDNLRKLRLILRIFPAEWFYIIEVTESTIKLQGYYDPDNIRFCHRYMKFDIDENGFISGNKENLKILFT